MTDMPVIIRNLNDDEAVILLVDANLYRPDIPPSKRAKAYKIKLEAIKHQGQRTDRRGCLFVRQPLSVNSAYQGYRRETFPRQQAFGFLTVFHVAFQKR